MVEKQQKPILEVKNLKKHFPIVRGFTRRVVGYTKGGRWGFL